MTLSMDRAKYLILEGIGAEGAVIPPENEYDGRVAKYLVKFGCFTRVSERAFRTTPLGENILDLDTALA